MPNESNVIKGGVDDFFRALLEFLRARERERDTHDKAKM